MDVGEWLRDLGLGEYEEKFRDNRIGADVLPRLTADDLKDIGVSAVGDRRRLLDEIGALAVARSSAEVPASQSKSAPAKGHPQISAERRPITVMFCDLVGSTDLAAQLDAEDWRDLVSAYLDQASGAVVGFGGHVLQRLGDGLMALFGYPRRRRTTPNAPSAPRWRSNELLGSSTPGTPSRARRELSARIGLDGGTGGGRRRGRGLRRHAEYRRARTGGRRAGVGARHRKRPAPSCRNVRGRGARRPKPQEGALCRSASIASFVQVAAPGVAALER